MSDLGSQDAFSDGDEESQSLLGGQDEDDAEAGLVSDASQQQAPISIRGGPPSAPIGNQSGDNSRRLAGGQGIILKPRAGNARFSLRLPEPKIEKPKFSIRRSFRLRTGEIVHLKATNFNDNDNALFR